MAGVLVVFHIHGWWYIYPADRMRQCCIKKMKPLRLQLLSRLSRPEEDDVVLSPESGQVYPETGDSRGENIG